MHVIVAFSMSFAKVAILLLLRLNIIDMIYPCSALRSYQFIYCIRCCYWSQFHFKYENKNPTRTSE